MADKSGTVAMTILTDEEVKTLKVVELKAELQRRQLPVYGKKADLQARLRAALLLQKAQSSSPSDQAEEANDDDNDEDEDEASNESYAEAVENANQIAASAQVNERQPMLTFRDIEESMERFSGDDDISVIKWLEDFEEAAQMSGWPDNFKVTYAKRLLKGSAKRFVMYERNGKTWASLKKALIDEFGETVDSYQIHQRLTKEKKKTDESYHEYVYRMMEIAAQADLETSVVIRYIIEGIVDEATNKVILYGAKTVKQLKERLTQYQQMKAESKIRQKAEQKKQASTREADKPRQLSKCFNCEEDNHLSRDCPEKPKGVKCFGCGEFGHIAARCPQNTKQINVIMGQKNKHHTKDVTVKGQQYSALVDTGSDVTFMRTDEYIEIGAPKLRPNKIRFEGLGSTENVTLGEFDTEIEIDGERFAVTFHVVPGKTFNHAILLGSDFLQ